MDDIDKINILNYWVKKPEKLLEIPDYLKDKFNRKDAIALLREIEPSKDSMGGTSSHKTHDFAKHIRKIKTKLKQELEIELIKVQKQVIQKQVHLQSQLNEKYDKTNFIMNKQTNTMRWQAFLTFLLILSTVIIGIATLSIQNKSKEISQVQANITRTQTEILKISSAPIEPTLKIWSPYRPLQLSVTDLLKKQGRREHINICITNLGRTNTGSIDIRMQNNWTHNSGTILINDGLNFGETNCSWLEFTAYDCWNDPDGCTEDIIPIGNISLNLRILCDRCVPNKFNKLFNACVWRQSTKEC